MRVRWSSAAANDLEQISNYLEKHHPSLAQPTVLKLYEAAKSLKRFSRRGRLGQVPGTRELVMTARLPYVIVYTVAANTVNIVRILHTSEKWPQ